MPITYKLDILKLLKENGYSTYRLRKDKIMGEAAIQKFRDKELCSWENLNTICQLTHSQPGDLVKYVEE